MIYIDPAKIRLPSGFLDKAKELTEELKTIPESERKNFFKTKRKESWGDTALVNALQLIAGNKCWYSEVSLDGHDPEVDHFRPKGQVKEVDCDNLEATGETSTGYWWLAFEPYNFRLSSQHANQRRIDEDTDGGKWDFFPVEGPRATEGIALKHIAEIIMPLDPCSFTDINLLWFEPEGNPAPSDSKIKLSALERKRVKVTIWLYHLDKVTIQSSRREHMNNVRLLLDEADTAYTLWDRHSNAPDVHQQARFNAIISKIRRDTADNAIYARAKRCTVLLAASEYSWLEEFPIF